MNRRVFFGKTGISIAACGISFFSPLASRKWDRESEDLISEDDQQLFIGEDIAVAQTKYGKVKGFLQRGIMVFRGIPYGLDTSGKNRFMPPQPPKPWKGTLPVVFYGNTAPQNIYNRSPKSYSAFVDHWNYDEVSEDCLRLNIWSPGIDGFKRPVLVWLHGGGFSNGNGIEQDGYNGENFSRDGNIVFCSINHRLGPFGFADFSGISEKYKYSGNVGMLDIVAALKWINENIQNFGGDPNNVTIMGQSGGGDKVCTLANMSETKGLVHKAVALSGSNTRALDNSYTRQLGRFILKEANLKDDEIDRLQEIPWPEYQRLAYKAAEKLQEQTGKTFIRGSFAPNADGDVIPAGEYFENKENRPDIPLLLCSTFHEWNPNRDSPELENISLNEVIDKLENKFGDRSKEIVGAYSINFPNARPIEIWALILSNRQTIIETANAKLKQNSSVYLAWFGWESPLFDGRHRSFHCLDISFWFLNTDRMITHTGGGISPRKLSKKMSESLIAFMKTGDPNCNSLPSWPKYTKENVETMILGNQCSVQYNPDKRGRLSIINS